MGKKNKKYCELEINNLEKKDIEKIKEDVKICNHPKYNSKFCPDCEIEKLFIIDNRMQKMITENDFELAVYQSLRKK